MEKRTYSLISLILSSYSSSSSISQKFQHLFLRFLSFLANVAEVVSYLCLNPERRRCLWSSLKVNPLLFLIFCFTNCKDFRLPSIISRPSNTASCRIVFPLKFWCDIILKILFTNNYSFLFSEFISWFLFFNSRKKIKRIFKGKLTCHLWFLLFLHHPHHLLRLYLHPPSKNLDIPVNEP